MLVTAPQCCASTTVQLLVRKEHLSFYFGENRVLLLLFWWEKSTFAFILTRKEYFCFYFDEKRVSEDKGKEGSARKLAWNIEEIATVAEILSEQGGADAETSAVTCLWSASSLTWCTFTAQTLRFECINRQRDKGLLIWAASQSQHRRDGNESCHKLTGTRGWNTGFREL